MAQNIIDTSSKRSSIVATVRTGYVIEVDVKSANEEKICKYIIIAPQLQLAFFNPLPDDKILEWFKLKQLADHILKCI